MAKYKTIKKRIIKIWKKSKNAILLALGATGLTLMINSIADFLPQFASAIYTFFVGLILVLIAGYFIDLKKKK